MENIIIVESPTKTKTIESYMGNNYKVLSSKGHIRDLSTSGIGGLGIDIKNNFTPNYTIIKGKEKVIKELVEACKNKKVYLATDPDREGEAISWHLAKVLNLDPNGLNRIVFNEITKKAITDAFLTPRAIDLNLVSSQETRRTVDRIIGFKLSKLLQSKISSKSAGRVQSVALKLIVDLEKEILKFIPEAYYEIEAFFKDFKAQFFKYNDKKMELKDKDFAHELYSKLSDTYIVKNLETKQSIRDSKPPFITSSLQQEAANKFNYNATRTMKIAQSLYEGIKIGNELTGLITYMRSDSIRLSNDFIQEANQYIKETYGDNYIGRVKVSKKDHAQDAHEAIRPTSIYRTPASVKEYLTKDELKIYTIIYNRALASLMSSSKFDVTKVELENNGLEFKTSGEILTFDGFLKVYNLDYEKTKALPKLAVGDKLVHIKTDLIENFTKPKSRYTEATLIKDMEELGIGRPSTYAQTMETLKARSYVVVEEKKIKPTEQGILTSEKLDEYFNDIINVKYTAQMEDKLDGIAKGEDNYLNTISKFYQSFIPMVEHASKNMEKIAPVKTDEICPQCGSNLVIRKGKYGEFLACGSFPNCRYIKKPENQAKEAVEIDKSIKCPKCEEGYIIERVASKSRNKGKKFYACSNFPKCKNLYALKPVLDKCPKCHDLLVETAVGIECINKECKKANEEKKT